MTPSIPAKRRRGGQPGNQNAKGNRGGKGAPFGNQYARKELPPASETLRREYPQPEAVEWISAHKKEIDASQLPTGGLRDRALYSGFVGITPERLAEKKLELRYRLFVPPAGIESQDEIKTAWKSA